MTKGWSLNLSPYTGLAGQIRRRMLAGVVLAEGLTLLGVGVLTGRLDLDLQALLLGAAIALGATFAGSLVGLRLMSRPLRAIDSVERSLIQLSRSEGYIPVGTPVTDAELSSSLVQAYNALINHLDELETRQLEVLRKVSHDLRAPLASIVGYAELLSDPDMRRDDAYLENVHQVIIQQGRQISSLLENVVTAAMVDTDRTPVKTLTFSLPTLVEEVVRDTRRQTPHAIVFTNEAGQVRVCGAILHLREALLNLLTNAAKYSPPDEPIFVHVAPGARPGWADVIVQDFGVGISERDQAQLFQPFTRIKNEYTGRVPGSGLGLYIASRIVQHHGGTISVKSEPGKGSTFTISLPKE